MGEGYRGGAPNQKYQMGSPLPGADPSLLFLGGGDPTWYFVLGATPRPSPRRSPPNKKYQMGSTLPGPDPS